MRPENFEAVRSGLARLTQFHGPIELAAREHAGDGFDAFNLSDICEYLDVPTTEKLYSDLLEVARSHARLAYWNTLVPRACPENLADRVRPLPALSRKLFSRDLAFFYSEFHVDEVV